MQKRSYSYLFFVFTMLLLLIIVGGCGGGGGGGGDSPLPPKPPTPTSPTLSNLQLSSGTLAPAFNSMTVQYTASVSNGVTSITVTPTTASVNATITVNGMNVTSGSASTAINLAVGTNNITIVVNGSGGMTTYTISITRAIPLPTLSNLQLSTGALSPAFNAATMQYTANVANSAASINVTPATTNTNTTIKINGNSVSSGNASPVNLNVGSNTIIIELSNSAGSTTYIVTVTRESSVAIYHKLTPAEALVELNTTTGYIILDVRSNDEPGYKAKRMKNSILIPHTEIKARASVELPNKYQYIYVYCERGIRSEMAARDLVDLGYTNVYDFGGMETWPYSFWVESDPPPQSWGSDGVADTSWWDNSKDSFIISTPAQLGGLANLCGGGKTSFYGKTVTLANDIELAGIDWTIIDYFEGTFDGGGKTISNMYIYSSSEEAVGLFGYLDTGGIIKNVILKDAEIVICPG